MRDVNRIEPLMRNLEQLWIKHPDMRLCQLLLMLNKGRDLFYLEDHELLELINEWLDKNNEVN
jgi:uncharacterized protein YihD (DUF1040 family)